MDNRALLQQQQMHHQHQQQMQQQHMQQQIGAAVLPPHQQPSNSNSNSGVLMSRSESTIQHQNANTNRQGSSPHQGQWRNSSPKRASNNTSSRSFDQNHGQQYPTELHRVCSNARTSTPSLLRATLLCRPGAAAITDGHGRLPLHCLSDALCDIKSLNSPISYLGGNDDDMSDFVLELWSANPHALVTTAPSLSLDGNNGNAGLEVYSKMTPFFKPLYQWIRDCHTLIKVPAIADDVNGANGEGTQLATAGNASPTRVRHLDDGSVLTLPTVFQPSLPNAPLQNIPEDPPETTRPPPTRMNSLPISGGASVVSATSYRSDNDKTFARRARKVAEIQHAARMNRVHNHPSVQASGSSVQGSVNGNDAPNTTTTVVAMEMYEDMFPTFDRLVRLPSVVQFSLSILSRIYEVLQNRDVIANDYEVDILQRGIRIAPKLVSGLASIPSLVKVWWLLLDRTASTQYLLNSPLMTRVVRHVDALGDWIVFMLESELHAIAVRGVEYLELLSDFTNEGEFAMVHPDADEQRRAEYLELSYKLAGLEYVIPSLLALPDSHSNSRISKNNRQYAHLFSSDTVSLSHRAACTPISQTVVDIHTTCYTGWPQSIAFIDFVFHLMLLISFHLSNRELLGLEPNSAAGYFVLVTLMYLLLRKLLEWKCLYKILSPTPSADSSCTAWMKHFGIVFGTFWNGVDVAAIGVVLYCAVALDAEWAYVDEGGDGKDEDIWWRNWFAIGDLLCWMKLFGLLRKCNLFVGGLESMIRTIIYDMRWVLFTLAGMVAAFGQIFFILLTKVGECENADGDGDDANRLCATNVGNFILRVYFLLFSAFVDIDDGGEDLSHTTFSMIMAMIFTFFVIVILFNAVIAIVVDSHQRWNAQRSKLMGYNRLCYVTELRAIERLLDGEWSLLQYCALILFVSSVSVLFLISVNSIRNTMTKFYGDSFLLFGVVILALFAVASIIAFLMHMNYFNFSTIDPASDVNTKGLMTRFLSKTVLVPALAYPIKLFVRSLLSIGESPSLPRDNRSAAASWHGTLSYVEDRMERNIGDSEDRTRAAFSEMVEKMEDRLNKHEGLAKADVLAEIRASEDRIANMVKDLQTLLSSGGG